MFCTNSGYKVGRSGGYTWYSLAPDLLPRERDEEMKQIHDTVIRMAKRMEVLSQAVHAILAGPRGPVEQALQSSFASVAKMEEKKRKEMEEEKFRPLDED